MQSPLTSQSFQMHTSLFGKSEPHFRISCSLPKSPSFSRALLEFFLPGHSEPQGPSLSMSLSPAGLQPKEENVFAFMVNRGKTTEVFHA